MKKWINISLGLVLILALFWGVFRYVSFLPIHVVEVDGDYWHISDQEIIRAIHKDVSKGYFNINIHQIQQVLMDRIPWLDTVTVTRVWPNRLVIQLFQKKPIALWNHNALLDQHLSLFYPLSPTFPEDLPLLEGDTAQAKAIAKQYQQMQALLRGQSLAIDAIKVSDGEHNWEVTFSNQVVVMLGNRDILTRFKRFIVIYQQLVSEKQQVPAYVDMRYSHGVAVKWALREERQDEVKAKK